MTSGGKRTGTVGFNVQTAVDTKYHVIVEHERSPMLKAITVN
jgi:hypothetical protein